MDRLYAPLAQQHSTRSSRRSGLSHKRDSSPYPNHFDAAGPMLSSVRPTVALYFWPRLEVRLHVCGIPLGYLDFNGRAFGMSAVARRGQDALLVKVMSEWEATLPHRKTPRWLEQASDVRQSAQYHNKRVPRPMEFPATSQIKPKKAFNKGGSPDSAARFPVSSTVRKSEYTTFGWACHFNSIKQVK
jgi:hypothetical protein